MTTATTIANALRPIAPGKKLATDDVPLIDRLAAQWDARGNPASDLALPVEEIRLDARGAAELVGHEAIVLEWYRDSEGVGTWGIGVTNASGHNVDRYKDKPQTVERCLEIYLWLLNTNYMPAVRSAFAGCKMTYAQFIAALSWHYNTGAIKRTDWVGMFKAGKLAEARKFMLSHYLNGGKLEDRRKDEAALFFDGKWSGDGTTIIWPVKKPSYTPDWSKPQRFNVLPLLEGMLP